VATMKRKRDIAENKEKCEKNIVCVAVSPEWIELNLNVTNQLSNGLYGTVFNMVWDKSIYKLNKDEQNAMSTHTHLCSTLYNVNHIYNVDHKKKDVIRLELSSYESDKSYVLKYIDFMSFLKVALLQQFQKKQSKYSKNIGKYFIDYIKSIKNEMMIKHYCKKYPEIIQYIVEIKDIIILSSSKKNDPKQSISIDFNSMMELLDQKKQQARDMNEKLHTVNILSDDITMDNDVQIDFYRKYNTKKHQQRVIKNWKENNDVSNAFFHCDDQKIHLNKIFIFMEKMEKTLWEHLIEPIKNIKTQTSPFMNSSQNKSTLDTSKEQQIQNSIIIFHSMLMCWLKLFVDYDFLHCDFHLKNIMTTPHPQKISITWGNKVYIEKQFPFFPRAIDFSQVMTPELVINWNSVPPEIQKKMSVQLSNFKFMIHEYFKNLKSKINNDSLFEDNESLKKIQQQDMYEIDFSRIKKMNDLKGELVHKISNLIN